MATPRVTARLLPVSPDGAVLLLQELDPVEPDRPYWSSIGGGVEDGEDATATILREAHEEAGIRVARAALVGPVHASRNAYSWNGIDYLGEHTWYALPLSRETEICFDHLAPDEVGTVLGYGWWQPQEVEGSVRRPVELPTIMRAAVAAVGGEQ
ncbi:NUDIX domain-containing protein [Nocardioides sp. GXZ039]|uniref:NUDIX domain-containing protein n=1 Tax=Nocardioides sp. GXZ039 TaxID=3136018 RepID=UPI0030F42834